jgi:hypothetical protein
LYLDDSRDVQPDDSYDLLEREGRWYDGLCAYQVDASLDCMLWTVAGYRWARWAIATTHVNGHGPAWMRNLPAPQAEDLPGEYPTVWIVPDASLENKKGVVTLV